MGLIIFFIRATLFYLFESLIESDYILLIEVHMKLQQVIDFVEDYSKPGFQAMWSFVVNVMRPFSSGMGLRIATLSPQQVEIVIPDWLRNKDEKFLHEATYLTAAKEGLRIWIQRLLGPTTEFELKSIQIKTLHPIEGNARVCFLLEDSEKEILLHHLQQKQNLEHVFSWTVLDENEMKCAEVELKVFLKLPVRLDSSSHKKNAKKKESKRVRN